MKDKIGGTGMTEKQRNMAIGAITFMVGNGYFSDAPETEDALNETIKTLAEMEEELERGKGHWILVKGSNGKDYHKCSECLHTQDITGVKNYCAACGSNNMGEVECE